jgi:hypothetical protein
MFKSTCHAVYFRCFRARACRNFFPTLNNLGDLFNYQTRCGYVETKVAAGAFRSVGTGFRSYAGDKRHPPLLANKKP